MGEYKHEKWSGKTYGSSGMHRWLIGCLKFIDVRFLYVFAWIFVVPPAMIFNTAATKAVYRFYRTAFCSCKLSAAWRTFLNNCVFAQIVIDKFAMYAGRKFDITVENKELFDNLASRPGAFIQLSAHIGNYEIAGYSLKSEAKTFNMLVYGGEKESVMLNRNRIFAGRNIRMVCVSPGMEHLFEVNRILSDGEILSMDADRSYGSNRTFKVDFFNRKASLPQGPFVLAASRQVPVLFVSVMKCGAKKYTVSVSRIDGETSGGGGDSALGLARNYASVLEETVKKYPLQWFNFYDFWTQ